MGGDAFTFELFGLTFNWTNLISGTIVFVITFFLLFGLSRHLQMKPT
ncbi:F0F1 ATP synthase subunit A, partial [Limosilactobacillus fermentum]|nr:F0F1 ATP synthase subunit A [Limosilactobacillus fermentum]